MDQPQVKAFVEYYIDNAATLSEEVGYVPLDSYDAIKEKIK